MKTSTHGFSRQAAAALLLTTLALSGCSAPQDLDSGPSPSDPTAEGPCQELVAELLNTSSLEPELIRADLTATEGDTPSTKFYGGFENSWSWTGDTPYLDHFKVPAALEASARDSGYELEVGSMAGEELSPTAENDQPSFVFQVAEPTELTFDVSCMGREPRGEAKAIHYNTAVSDVLPCRAPEPTSRYPDLEQEVRSDLCSDT
ncbi:hypothetical protein [Glutamicibacter sp. X7]